MKLKRVFALAGAAVLAVSLAASIPGTAQADEEKVLIDVKSLYRMDELKASDMRFWRL